MSAKIFISMGTPYNDRYLAFRDELENMLRSDCNCDPRIIGKNEYPDGNPLKKILDVMRDCQGVIVVAYERKHILKGSERRGSDNQVLLDNKVITTPWNHVESAMAFALGIPLYIICQSDLHEEALIESKMDWYVQKISITPKSLREKSVSDSIKSWVDHKVLPYSSKSREKAVVQGKLKLSDMTISEIGIIFGALSTTFALGFALSQFLKTIGVS